MNEENQELIKVTFESLRNTALASTILVGATLIANVPELSFNFPVLAFILFALLIILSYSLQLANLGYWISKVRSKTRNSVIKSILGVLYISFLLYYYVISGYYVVNNAKLFVSA